MSSFIRRIGATFLASAFLFGGYSAASAGTIKMGMVTWVGYGPLFLARDLGYFKEKGLNVELDIVEESSLYMAGLASKELQGVATTVDTYIQYRSKDACFKAVYALDDSHGGDGVLVSSDIKSFSHLKGKEVGLNEGGVSQFWFNLLLKQNGMTEKDVSITNMTADDAAAAFMADRIPVAVTWEPHLTLAKSKGKGSVLIDSKATPGAIVDVVVLGCDVIKNQPDDVKALVDGLNRANELIAKDPQKAYEIMAKGVGGWLTDPKDFASSASGVTFYGKDRNEAFFNGGDGSEMAKLIGLASDIWGGFGKLKTDIKYGDVVDASFLGK